MSNEIISQDLIPRYDFLTVSHFFNDSDRFYLHFSQHPSFTEFLNYVHLYRAKQTYRLRAMGIDAFRAYLAQHYCPIQDGVMTRELLYHYCMQFMRIYDGKSEHTFRQINSTLKAWLTFCYHNLIIASPLYVHAEQQFNIASQERKTAARVRRIENTLTPEEIHKFFMYLKRHQYDREYIAAMLMYNCILRVNEVLALKRKDFMLDVRKMPILRVIGKTERKAKQPNFVQIDPPEIVDIVFSYMDEHGLTDPEDYVITRTARKSGAVTKAGEVPYISLYPVLNRLSMKAIGKRITSHAMKRSAINALDEAQVPHERISKKARTSIATISKHYVNQHRHDLGKYAIL
jgi:integrase